jgi:hypothetical protein
MFSDYAFGHLGRAHRVNPTHMCDRAHPLDQIGLPYYDIKLALIDYIEFLSYSAMTWIYTVYIVIT